MGFLRNQLAGKYKEVPFFVTKETLNSVGQTRIKHTYPKTSVQYMEAMGKEPFNCTIEIFFSGNNYQDDFQKFKKAIESSTPGRLFLPSFGVFNSIIAPPASFTVEQKQLGQISATVTFLETIDKPSPTLAIVSFEEVSEQAQLTRDELKELYEDSYIIPETFNNLITGKIDAETLAEAVKKITGLVNATKVFLRKVDQRLKDTLAYASLLLNSIPPEGFLQEVALSFDFNKGFTIFKQVATVGTDLPNSMNDITSGKIPIPSTIIEQTPEDSQINTNINLWPEDTEERKKRNHNRLLLINAFRLVGLIGLLESAASGDYLTTEEVDQVVKIIDLYYMTLIENDTTGVVIPELKIELDTLKSQTDIVLKNKRQQAFAVTEIKRTRPISSTLLAYELYGETIQNETQLQTAAEIIKGLNRSQPAHKLNGIIKVVEIVSGN